MKEKRKLERAYRGGFFFGLLLSTLVILIIYLVRHMLGGN